MRAPSWRLESDADPPRPPVVAVGPHVALSTAHTAGVRLFARCSPVHSVIIGRCRLQLAGSIQVTRTVALPANTPHTVLALEGPYASVAYLDARRYSFADAQRLAHRWRGFDPSTDDLRDAFEDALAPARRRIDVRLLRALEALDLERLTVAQAALRVGLSESRLTHLMTDTLGAPPRSWRAWFKLRRAIGEKLFAGANLTEAAHRAGFADSAHFTRTCKQATGVAPGRMLSGTAYVFAQS